MEDPFTGKALLSNNRRELGSSGSGRNISSYLISYELNCKVSSAYYVEKVSLHM
jgi:hypothetical protein